MKFTANQRMHTNAAIALRFHVVERVRDLGFGFRDVMFARPVQVSFESIGHFGYLYYGNTQLCQLGKCSVSPSGDYAAYQDGPSGNLYLFHRISGRLTQLTRRYPGFADRFIWHEDQAAVVVRLATWWRPERTYALDKKAQPSSGANSHQPLRF